MMLLVGFLLALMAILIVTPIVFVLLKNVTNKQKEAAKGKDEDSAPTQRFVTEKEILAKRVDMRIWDALNTKFGKGNVAKYVPMGAYTEGGDMDIVVVFTDGTSGIYRAYLPLCKLRGAEQKNASEDYRRKPGQKNKKEELFEYIKKNIVADKPLLVPKEMYAEMDVAELTEDILFEELADKVNETNEGLSLLLQRKN